MKVIKTKKINSIDSNLIKDNRLKPLFELDSKLLLQFYILEININGVKQYEIVYGFAVMTTREDISNELAVSDFRKIHVEKTLKYSVAKLSVYNYSQVIIKLINELLEGKTLKTALTNRSILSNKLKFDVLYNASLNGHCSIRPIIFNEVNPLVSRNFYEKNILNSPFNSVPAFSLIISNNDKKQIFTSTDKSFFVGWEKALWLLLNYLKEETSMYFTTNESIRFGNIEFLNTQCANPFEVAHVNYKNISKDVIIDGFTEKASQTINVYIKSNIYTCSKSILVNCFATNGGQIILDECKEVIHPEGNCLEISFNTEEPITNMVVSIWRKENESYQIWYKNSGTLIRNMSLKMGIVGTTGTVQSPWLEKIENISSKLKDSVAKAKEISKASYQTSTITTNKLDPWVDAESEFSTLVKRMSPKKSEGAFFPKGWDSETNEHGALSFLEWFKNIADSANKVVIQDPFYDTLGLEFLARTTNSSTEFSILTCTQIFSIDDDKKKYRWIDKLKKWLNIKSENKVKIIPNRTQRILNFIASFPSLFSNVKLSIYDLRSLGNGDNNLLHDRYLLIFNEGLLKKGFHLSNSIQGASKNHPLLITPIPEDILLGVNTYINDLINSEQGENSFKVEQLYDYKKSLKKETQVEPKKIKDEKLYKELQNIVLKDKIIDKDVLKSIINKPSNLDYHIFMNFWIKFGTFIAENEYSGEFTNAIVDVINPELSKNLRAFLEHSLDKNSMIKFSTNRGLERSNFYILSEKDFDKALKNSINASDYLHEIYGYGNYGVCYASKILFKINFDEYLKFIDFLILKYNELNGTGDLSNTPLLKLLSIAFSHVAKKFFFYGDIDFIELCLKTNLISLKALSISALISDVIDKRRNIDFKVAEELFLNLNEQQILSVYITFLHELKFKNDDESSQLESKCMAKISDIIQDFSIEKLYGILDRIVISYYDQIEAKVMRDILIPLVKNGKIKESTVTHYWAKKFEDSLDKFESTDNLEGLLYITGWTLVAMTEDDRNDFKIIIKKKISANMAEIRKPFKKGELSWIKAYDIILLIQIVYVNALLQNDKNNEKLDEPIIISLKEIITEIEIVKTNYQYHQKYHKIEELAKKKIDDLSKIKLPF